MASKILNELIAEGFALKDTLYKNAYGHYDIDTSRYEMWKQTAIRILSIEFPGDRCIKDFENAVKVFDNYYYPSSFDALIGILSACRDNPTIIRESSFQNKEAINISVNQTQSQTQEQAQSIAIEIFIEAIKDELTGKQVKEIKGIYTEEPDPKKVRIKIFDKIKSLGLDVTSNILANILTNPAIWGNL